MQDITQGDTVRVQIENNAPIGPATQGASFEAEEIHMDKVIGTDPAWGDECVLSGLGTDEMEYKDGGKSGKVVEISVN